jgi:hypothetical protein
MTFPNIKDELLLDGIFQMSNRQTIRVSFHGTFGSQVGIYQIGYRRQFDSSHAIVPQIEL